MGISLAHRRWLELGGCLALMVGAVAIAGLWSSARSPAPARAFDVFEAKTSAPAPDFELTDLTGRPVRLQDFRGRVVLLNFWATWCVPCRDEIPAMETLSRELGARGLAVLAVNYKESPPLVTGFAREYGLTLPVLLDPEGGMATRYGLVGLPATYFIDRSGVLAASVLGFRDWNAPEARAYLDRLLARQS